MVRTPVTRGEISPFSTVLFAFCSPGRAMAPRTSDGGPPARPAWRPSVISARPRERESSGKDGAVGGHERHPHGPRVGSGGATRRKESRQRGPAPALPVVPAALGVLRPPPAAPPLGGARRGARGRPHP